MPAIKKQTRVTRRKKSGSVVDRISPISFDDIGIKINLYGRSGTGKTTLWGTFPGKILAIVCSGSKQSAEELRSLNTPAMRKKVDQVVLQSSMEIDELVDYAQDSKYKTVVLDHITDFQGLILQEILQLDKIPEQLSWGLATQQQYGQCTLQLKEHLRKLLNLTCNVVLIGQQREYGTSDDDSELAMPYVAASLTPSGVGWLNPACSYICQTFIRSKTIEKQIKIGDKTQTTKVKTGDMEYCLRTGPHSVFTTKFRVPKGTKLPDAIVNPSYDKIMELINGG